MNLKGTQSEKNIQAALMGESLARNKYTFYAMQANKEGHPEIATLFERMAKNETTHAKIWFNMLYGTDSQTRDNLIESANGENSEWDSMYPSFAETARKEGLLELADMFDKVAAIEKMHEETFLKAIISLSNKHNTNKEGSTESVKPMQPTYRCQFCGAVFETRPDSCSVCQAIGSFDTIEIQ